MVALSILIPARNEIFLGRTIADILEHSEADTEIIAVLDGYWPEPGIPQNERVTILHYPESIGQRAATNRAASIARGRYLMKVDAHCAFAQGFDRILLEDMQPDYCMVPVMRNLHAFDWVCPNGHRRYQGPSGVCAECGEPTTMDMVWIAKTSPQSTAYRFDTEPHFQYFNEYKKRPEGRGDLTETMSLQGSCFMISRDNYFAWNVSDESWGSWGSQGIEVAFKTWMHGGRVMCDHRTWYAHMFRTQGGDFSFPYEMSAAQQEAAKGKAREFINSHPDTLKMLLDKFAPVPGWEQRGSLSSGVLYYTDNRLDPAIMAACQEQLRKAADGRRIVSVSLAPLDFGDNITLNLERGYLTMFRQILAGLEALDCDVVYFAEHDVLYHPSHFAFVPPENDRFYYNVNVWKLRLADGHGLHYDCRQTSGLAAYRELLLQHYRERVRRTEAALAQMGDTREYRNWIRAQGFEPGTHNRPERVDDYRAESYQSESPNVDIRHDGNLTPSRWSQDEFRNRRNCRGWIEADTIPGWGNGADLAEAIHGR